MGLDIAFSRAAALGAGCTIEVSRIGTDREADAALAEGDHMMAVYYRTTQHLLKVPGIEWHLDAGCGEDCVVRANKWGVVYAPLTAWLKSHGIEWTEF